MRAPGTRNGNRLAVAGLNVAVSAIAALSAAVLAGVALDGDDEFRFGFDAPHRVNQIASVLGAQLEAKLAAKFAGTEPRIVSG